MSAILIPILAIAGLGLIFGLGLAFASKKFEVKVDPKISEVREVLPGANCGACGYTGCDAYAEAVAAGDAAITLCPVGGEDVINSMAEVMGIEAKAVEKMVARVNCKGSWENVKIKFDYDGIIDCESAATLYGGPSACAYGCVGMGTCVKACNFGALVLENGLAKVIDEKCSACGKCIEACPKRIIELVPAKSQYTVLCSNLEKGGEAKKKCEVACIGCGKCMKECPFEAITVKNFCAKIDYEKCKNCGKCLKVCPTNAIHKFVPHK